MQCAWEIIFTLQKGILTSKYLVAGAVGGFIEEYIDVVKRLLEGVRLPLVRVAAGHQLGVLQQGSHRACLCHQCHHYHHYHHCHHHHHRHHRHHRHHCHHRHHGIIIIIVIIISLAIIIILIVLIVIFIFSTYKVVHNVLVECSVVKVKQSVDVRPHFRISWIKTWK